MYVLALAVIGAIAVAVFVIESLWSLFELISSYLMPYFIPTEVLPLSKKFGSWAAITGSTDGIGKQYALELAQRGINVVLISRNVEKLKKVADEIEKLHSVKTKTIVADFSKGTEIYPHIEEQLKDIPLGILVNNVGVQYEYPMPLCELPAAKAWEIINVNVVAVTSMTRMVLPGMVARGQGAIVNVSSGSELQPLPLMSVYAATKVYVRNFTFAIRDEYSSKGIHIQHLSPLFVSTKMNNFSQKLLDGNMLVPDATTYTRHAITTLGRVQNTTGYWLHGIQYFFIKLAPEWIRIKIGAQINREFREEHMQHLRTKI
ncbi:inactive hydroxysteroid dehydrogenase-like protein 1 isoform X1 [Vanessa atalanta]|uniref:inactive hydroxysteroid dehydrogenase-like protein 1 isoform X1 n=2 Tax=Vanessa atalanta TaxID=42275 RepID=UPI001FCD5AFC|nr:inactive hydroxysteroid dehydrogenase-like protein 1 isoform X1 [Vanessa atalanta]